VLRRTLTDLELSLPQDAFTTTTTWATPTGGGQHLTTDYQYDNAGRMTWKFGPAHYASVGGVNTLIRTTTEYAYCDERSVAHLNGPTTEGAGTISLGGSTPISLYVMQPYETWTVSGYEAWDDFTQSWGSFTPAGTITIAEYDRNHRLVATGEKPLAWGLGGGATLSDSYSRYAKYVYNDVG
jgi:hypothetical protein